MSFKICPSCQYVWKDRNEFLVDPEVCVVGYQVSYGELNAGCFLFNHYRANCCTTMAIRAGDFTDLHEGPIFETHREDVPDCPGYCDHEKLLDPCETKCECSYVRDVLQRVKNWPKTAA